jgi:hypothetical protein
MDGRYERPDQPSDSGDDLGSVRAPEELVVGKQTTPRSVPVWSRVLATGLLAVAAVVVVVTRPWDTSTDGVSGPTSSAAPSTSPPALSPTLLGVWEGSATNLESSIAPTDRHNLTPKQAAFLAAELPHRGRLIFTISGRGTWRLAATNFHGSSVVLEHGNYQAQSAFSASLEDTHNGGSTVVLLDRSSGARHPVLNVRMGHVDNTQGSLWTFVQRARFGTQFRLVKHSQS